MMELNADPEVIRYTGDVPFVDEREPRAIVERLRRQFEARRMGRFVVLHRVTGEKLGWCGLRWNAAEEVADLGYRFCRRYWGQGFATESSEASIRYGFEELGLDRIVAHAMKANVASVRVLERLGFKQTGHGIFDGFESLGFELRRTGLSR